MTKFRHCQVRGSFVQKKCGNAKRRNLDGRAGARVQQRTLCFFFPCFVGEKFPLFPLTQNFLFFIPSFSDGWAKDDLIYRWKEKDPVQIVPGLHLPRFTLEKYDADYCDVITNTGKSYFPQL